MGFRIEISEKLNKKIKKMDKNVQKMLYSYIAFFEHSYPFKRYR